MASARHDGGSDPGRIQQLWGARAGPNSHGGQRSIWPRDLVAGAGKGSWRVESIASGIRAQRRVPFYLQQVEQAVYTLCEPTGLCSCSHSELLLPFAMGLGKKMQIWEKPERELPEFPKYSGFWGLSVQLKSVRIAGHVLE